MTRGWTRVLIAGAAAMGLFVSARAAPVRVVATTTIVGNVVAQVGGDAIALDVLLPPGADPHAFEPTPQDLARISEADLLFVNGGGLEASLDPVLHGAARRIVSVSEGVPFRLLDEEEHGGSGLDPHVWFDPTNVAIWATNIARALTEVDPAGGEGYALRAQAYREALADLDLWIVAQVSQIPLERRRLVADHAALGYFADRYGFTEVGVLFPGGSTLAEPSAAGLAALEEAIRALGVSAIFVSTTVNPGLAEQVAEETGIQLRLLYTETLSTPGGPAATYLDLMRHDVAAIVEGLGGGP